MSIVAVWAVPDVESLDNNPRLFDTCANEMPAVTAATAAPVSFAAVETSKEAFT